MWTWKETKTSCICVIVAVCIYWFLHSSVLKHKMSDKEKAEELFKRFWEWRLADSPEFATFIGNHSYDDHLESYSLDSYDRRKHACQLFLNEITQLLEDISENSETTENLKLLSAEISVYVTGLEAKGYLFPVNYLEGAHVEVDRLIAAMPYNSVEDYKKLISRLDAFPQQISEIIELLKEGIKLGMTNHKVSMDSVFDELKQLYVNAEDSVFFKPLSNMPQHINAKDRMSITSDVTHAIIHKVYPAFRKLEDFLQSKYARHLRPNIGISTLPNGKLLYEMCLEYHLGYKISPEEVHNIGINEVKRIEKEMEEVIASLELSMSKKEFSVKIKADKGFYFETPEELLEAYKGLLFNKIHPELHKIFKNIPKSQVIIEPTPPSKASAPIAYYLAGTPDGRRPGTFFVNTAHMESSPKYEMMTLALHEGEPGHHLQISYMMEREGIPDFRRFLEDRKYSDAPAKFPLHTAYVEGWGLYSEYLGYELGMYEDPYFHFGHLSFEMFRACRLVVDTGIHAFGWSYEEAVDYMVEHTAMHKHQVINRYVTWPGQACAYKIGEIKIKELRKKAESHLGTKFDVREFHDVVLRSPGPLSILEQNIDAYIKEAG